MSEPKHETSPVLSDLPADELFEYGLELGLRLDHTMTPGEVLRRIRERQELLASLDRDALLDICVWARRPVRKSASKEELAKEIVTITRMRFADLSHRGLVALAQLRGVRADANEDDEIVIQRMRRAEPLWSKIRRKRRGLMGAVLSKLITDDDGPAEDEYKFLPEHKHPAWREQIEEIGVVRGMAQRIRGVADDYVHEKLDEIERRIDQKLDEIDRRLAEWRDREIANRLRIIKITLVVSIVVAGLSLGYSALRARVVPDNERAAPTSAAPEEAPQ